MRHAKLRFRFASRWTPTGLQFLSTSIQLHLNRLVDFYSFVVEQPQEDLWSACSDRSCFKRFGIIHCSVLRSIGIKRFPLNRPSLLSYSVLHMAYYTGASKLCVNFFTDTTSPEAQLPSSWVGHQLSYRSSWLSGYTDSPIPWRKCTLQHLEIIFYSNGFTLQLFASAELWIAIFTEFWTYFNVALAWHNVCPHRVSFKLW